MFRIYIKVASVTLPTNTRPYQCPRLARIYYAHSQNFSLSTHAAPTFHKRT